MPPPPAPTAQRHALLDALRGFALVGVLLANLRMLSLYDLLPRQEKAALPTAAVDRIVNDFMTYFVNGTSVTLFTLLFGVGFAMQMQRLRDTGRSTATYARRLFFLLMIGLAHAYLLWWGDILRYYAILGFALIPVARWRAPWLILLGAFTVLVLPVLLQPIVPGLLPSQISSSASASRSLEAFSSSDWRVMLQGNLSRDLRMRIAVWILPTYIFGRMLIGVALGNSGMLTHPQEHRGRWRTLWWGSLIGAVVLTGLVAGRRYDLIDLQFGSLSRDTQRILWRVIYNAAPLALGLFYMSSFVQLYAIDRCRVVLAWLAPLGRMALTSYLGHSVLGVAVFYGVGLGVGPRYGAIGVLLGAAIILAVQIVFCRWWLARYRFGPLEWVWRSLTYGARQPLRL